MTNFPHRAPGRPIRAMTAEDREQLLTARDGFVAAERMADAIIREARRPYHQTLKDMAGRYPKAVVARVIGLSRQRVSRLVHAIEGRS